ncbi:hypothetical protein JGG94_23840, partial [Salmonella enterica subsp. enterica serovar Infantis]|nr:hypothetical protein [Salmonella enterica subsp. enterica serovar Infantis]
EEIANDENLYVYAPMGNTYEPFQANRNGDVLDVFCFRSFSSYYTLQVHRELTSDHFPVELDVANVPIHILPRSRYHTDWDAYTSKMGENIYLHSHLMLTKEDIDVAVTKFTEDIKSAVSKSSNEISAAKNPFSLPPYLKGGIRHRNRLRKRWKINYSTLARETYVRYW